MRVRPWLLVVLIVAAVVAFWVATIPQGRTDLTFIQDCPQIYHSELADSALQFVRDVSPQRPVYFAHRTKGVAERFDTAPAASNE